jgi:hypothetical protein
MTQPDEVTRKVLDYAETRLAFRVWRCDPRRGVLLSVNAGLPAKKNTWLLPNAISSPEGEWKKGDLMIAECTQRKKHENGVPDPDCTCGIYAMTDLEVVNSYLRNEAPVLGIVELGGRTIPATQGYRAEAVRVAALLLIDEIFTLKHDVLAEIADQYKVPVLVPHSTQPEDYRSEIHQPGFGAADWEQLKRLLDDH